MAYLIWIPQFDNFEPSKAEIFLNGIIIWKVPYTEIDWKAYMSEVEGYLNGSTNY